MSNVGGTPSKGGGKRSPVKAAGSPSSVVDMGVTKDGQMRTTQLKVGATNYDEWFDTMAANKGSPKIMAHRPDRLRMLFPLFFGFGRGSLLTEDCLRWVGIGDF
jgi:hypothetical protein